MNDRAMQAPKYLSICRHFHRCSLEVFAFRNVGWGSRFSRGSCDSFPILYL